MTADRFSHSTYLIRRRILSLLGGKFEIYDPAGNVVLFSKMKAFKLKEDIRLYTDETMTAELISIQARTIMDFSAAYDVVDSTTGRKIGALKRKGWKSLMRDEWIIMDVNDNEIGGIQEDNAFVAFIRRFVTNLIPQTFNVQLGGQPVAEFKQNFNPFVSKLTLDFSLDVQRRLDRRLGIAAGVLLCAIEGKQEG
ncbi:MAG TPA: hypothetical protein PLD20_10350 [Blastocatellia bacterium]|nr:hypothetical protein [Blastocatellia bacterium]HMV84370.1 hypothetical protein [Blastocatellia bacterium]HMX26602.1 hypothetical protein [Blastocatellia bacterium]HMY74201.1 hypothetical protein [Blastocatellia bacterium]HMZ18319.1 hypothetical protein [Blastocatellia bacterium]